MLSHRVYNLCKKFCDGAELNQRCISGYLTPATLDKIMQFIPRGARKVFYDIGAGPGRVLYAAVLSYGFESAEGCEYMENDHLQTIFLGLKGEFAKLMGSPVPVNIEFQAFRDIPDHVNVVYTFNAAFKSDDNVQIAEKVLQATGVKYFVCTKCNPFSTMDELVSALDDKFAPLGTVKGKMGGSGEQRQIFVLVRK